MAHALELEKPSIKQNDGHSELTLWIGAAALLVLLTTLFFGGSSA